MSTLTRGAFAEGGSSIGFKTGDWRLVRPISRAIDAPCSTGCPAGENPRGYLAKIAEGDLRGAWETLVSANPMPAITGRVCHHPCEDGCNRGNFDKPIAIHSVERFLGDRAIAEGWNYPQVSRKSDAAPVAVVGAGPAGLSAAYHLAQRGFAATLFEAEPEPGGLLRTALPPYRLPRAVLNVELERLIATGITFEPNQRLGRDLSLDEIRANFRAIFLGPGTQRPREWSVDKMTRGGIRGGLDLLKEWISIGAIPACRSVAIIGGGNTAIDLARVLKFSGVAEVHVITFQVLPGPGVSHKDAMSATVREIRQAIEEGVTIHDRRGVRRIITRGDAIVGVEMVHMRELETAGGRRDAVAFEGTETVLKVDSVIPAIGQEIDPAGFESLLGQHQLFAPDHLGRLIAHPGIFVGGDARTAGGTVSGAIGDGRRAAIAIHHYLEGLAQANLEPRTPISFAALNVNYFDHAPRAEAPIVPSADRGADREIEGTISHEQLRREARRCFSCGDCMSCDNCWTLCPDNSVLKTDGVAEDKWRYVFDYDHCKGCGICAHECPVGYIAVIDEP